MSLRTKKVLFWPKIAKKNWVFRPKLTNFQKKKEKKMGISGQKNKLGLSLRTKKIFWAKNREKIEKNGQKLTNFQKKKKKKGHFRPKKQAVAELENKKRIFLSKNCEKKLSFKAKN